MSPKTKPESLRKEKEKEVAQLSAVSEHSHAHLNFHGRRVTSELREGYISSLKLILRGSLPPSQFKKGEEGLPRQAGLGLRKNFKLVGILTEPRKLRARRKDLGEGKEYPNQEQNRASQERETQEVWDLRS